jgi:hypothetical protein
MGATASPATARRDIGADDDPALPPPVDRRGCRVSGVARVEGDGSPVYTGSGVPDEARVTSSAGLSVDIGSSRTQCQRIRHVES